MAGAGRRSRRGGIASRLGTFGLAIAAGAAVLSQPETSAAPCSPAYQFRVDTGGPGAASVPVNDTNFPIVPSRSRSYFTQGTQLVTVHNRNYPIGCVGTPQVDPCTPNGSCTRFRGCKLPTWTPTPASTLSAAPTLVSFSQDTSKAYLFLGADNGRLYKIDVTGESPFPTLAIVDTRRPSCASDKVVATPAVQLYASANTAFRNRVDSFGASHTGDDVIFVITSTGCGDQTHNRVIAYFASDTNPMWEFNAPRLPGEEAGSLRVGAGSEGCTVDYANNRLFCGTAAPPGSDQDSLWAIDTLTGRLIWSDHSGGAVLNRPILHTNGRLYVVSQPGSLWAYNPAGDGQGGPSRSWSAGLSVASTGAIVTRSPWVDPGPGTFQDKILVLDSAGTLRAAQDNGSSGALLWAIKPTDSGGRWVSTPVVLPGAGTSYAFIGRSDGYLQQIKLEGGRPQGIMQIATTSTQDVYDPSIDPDPQTGQSVVAVAGTRVARVAVPICTDDPSPGPSTCFDECFQPTDWDPYCQGSACVTPSCRNPRFNPKYNPCTSLAGDPIFACIGLDPELGCDFGPGFGCRTNLTAVVNGNPCDDGWPGSQGSIANKGAATCRSDAIPALAACTLAEGSDCNYTTGASQPGSRFKCVTKPAVCGSVGGGKCCVCNDGFGMNCNDRCFQGACVSDLVTGCPLAGAGPARDSACIAAGDRACGAGLTCCGSNTGGTCTSDSQCTASPQGTCLDLNPLDADTSKSCYYQRCADLSDDPQHCGACGTDCGDYAISATACADNLGCGSCNSDLDCAALGAGQCVDGTCGKCRGNTASTGPACGAACTSDAQCAGAKCTNGFCCAAGSECVGGACRPLVCHRLTDRGSCAGGICTGGGVCSGPSAADLAAASQPGMCAIDFAHTNEPVGPSLCDAYVTNYRTDLGAALVKIDSTGATQTYTGVDATRLNGVAVSRDGGQLFASMVDAGTPGLALRPPGATVYSLVRDTLPTGGLDDNPFDQAEFNRGPVGPAFDDVTFTNDASRKVWFGNFPNGTCGDQELCRVDFSGLSWIANEETYCNQPCADADGHCEYTVAGCGAGSPQRITAIAFASRMYAPAGVYHRFLVVAHGTTLSFVDLDGGTPRQHDIDLTSPAVYVPEVARGESTIEAVLSIAPVPYGDVVLEVRGSGDRSAPGNVRNTWPINVNAHDRSVRHERDVQRSLKHINPCGPGDSCPAGFSCVESVCMKTCGTCPAGFSCNSGACRLDGEVPANFGVGAGSNAGNGRLGVKPDGRLMRWVAAVSAAPAGLTEYDTIPATPLGCDDGNACTIDGLDLVTGQCEHLPVNCQDLDPCTIDSCTPATGQCFHTPVTCDDSDVCTADACQPGTGACLHTPIVLAEPGPVQFATSVSFQWPPTGDATHWNAYRGTIPATMLGSRLPGAVYDQVCFENADAFGDGPTTSTDAAIPPLGTGYYYLVTGEASCESSLGYASSGASIPNDAPCPTPP